MEITRQGRQATNENEKATNFEKTTETTIFTDSKTAIQQL